MTENSLNYKGATPSGAALFVLTMVRKARYLYRVECMDADEIAAEPHISEEEAARYTGCCGKNFYNMDFTIKLKMAAER